MRPTHPIVKFVLATAVFACLLFATSCTSVAPDGVKSSSLVSQFFVTDANGHLTALACSDLNTSVVYGGGTATGQVVQKPSDAFPNGLPIFGPVGSAFGKVFIYDHQRKKRLSLDWGAPWPAFCRAVLFPAQAAAFGIHFDDEAAASPPAAP